ncbi:MAG: hypothetical protein A2Z34_03105 [Planctomycetes bacterium RBG_16_59_8]|nr:MAG: hypothetical protein A2Z34_03105 [Planctomycetes bacterium RBG_16_59_8]
MKWILWMIDGVASVFRSEELPDAPPREHRPRFSPLINWLSATEHLPEPPSENVVKSKGVLPWLLSREQLPEVSASTEKRRSRLFSLFVSDENLPLLPDNRGEGRS